jgi:hypothetical protein
LAEEKARQARDEEITRKGREAEQAREQEEIAASRSRLLQARKQEEAARIQQQKAKEKSLRRIKIQEAKDLDMQRQRQGLIPLNAGTVTLDNGRVRSAKTIMDLGEVWLEGTYKDKSFNEFIPGLPAIAKKNDAGFQKSCPAHARPF